MVEGRAPGSLRMLWLAFMQPVKLHRVLRECGFDWPGAREKQLRGMEGARRRWVAMRRQTRLAGVLGVLVVGLVVPLGLSAAGASVNFWFVVIGVPFGISGLFYATVTGPIEVLTTSVIIGGALGIAGTLQGWLAWSVVTGAAVGLRMSFQVSPPRYGLPIPGSWHPLSGLRTWLAFAISHLVLLLLTMAAGAVVGVIVVAIAHLLTWTAFQNGSEVWFGAVNGAIGGFVAGLCSYRVPVYVIEAVVQSMLYCFQRVFGVRTLHLAPVLYHELSHFPHPTLARHLSLETDPILLRRLLDACAVSPGQRAIVYNAQDPELEWRILSEKLAASAEDGRFSDISDELLKDVAKDHDAAQFLEAARHIQRGQSGPNPAHRLRHLELAEAILEEFGKRLLEEGSTRAHAYLGVVSLWRDAVTKLRRSALISAKAQVPNPFRPGRPLSPEAGGSLFQGRAENVQHIGRLTNLVSDNRPIALISPSCFGKTSLLQMLPRLLPDVVCVFIDLQQCPVGSPSTFLNYVCEQAIEQASRRYEIHLSRMPVGAPFEAACQWLDLLDGQESNLHLLFCFDEIAVLRNCFESNEAAQLKLVGLFRGIIEERRNIRLLFSGQTPPSEVSKIWSNHLSSVHGLRLGYLDRRSSLNLLCQPSESFPKSAISHEVARAIYGRTGGQPYLMQEFGSQLVAMLNEQERRQSRLNDIADAEDRVLSVCRPFFVDTVERLTQASQNLIQQFAQEDSMARPEGQFSELRERLVLDNNNRFAIPLFAEWIKREIL